MQFRYISSIFVAGVSLLTVGAASANTISLFETQFDTDWTISGVGGLRGTGAGEIALSGVSGTVTQAYLYYHGPTNSNDPNFNANISFNNSAITGTNIGFSDDNFWDQDNSQAYRADVTSLVNGDGTFEISGLPGAHANGASLIVFYDDGDASNNRDVVMFDGNDANFANPFDPLGWNVTLSGIDYDSGDANMVLSVSDGQDFDPLDDSALVLNGITIAGPGDVFQGTTVPTTPGTSVTNGGLWDIEEFDVTSFLVQGLNTLNLTHGPTNDALSLINVAIDLPAGSAPGQPTPSIPEPSSLALFGIGVLGLGVLRGRTRKTLVSR